MLEQLTRSFRTPRYKKPTRYTSYFSVKNVLLSLYLLLSMQQCWAWERAKEITVTPWYKDVQTRAEFRRHLIDFSPGAPMRDVRLKAEGLFGRSFSKDECSEIAQLLMKKLDPYDEMRLPGRTFDGKPVYFSRQRFFLVSIEPAVLIIVPTEFSFKRVQPSTDSTFLHEVRSEYHRILEAEEKIGINSFVTNFTNEKWFNYLELSNVIPVADSIQVISALWDKPVSLSEVRADDRWPFKLEPSQRFPKHIEIVSRRAVR